MSEEASLSQDQSQVRHHYPLAVRDASLGTAFGLFMKTLPYALVRFALLLGVSVATLLWAVVTFGGGAWLMEKTLPPVGWIWIGAGCATYGAVWRLVLRYVLYLIKCGHIAVLTELVVNGQIANGQEGMFAYGKRIVKERFVQVNVLFAMDRLVDGVVRSFNRTLDRVGGLLPIPGMDGLMKIVKAIMYSASTYIDETIFSYVLARNETNPWRGGQDGLIYYCQNAKPILKTALWVVVLDKVLTVLIWALFLAPAVALAHFFPGAAGVWAFFIAVLLAWNARCALLEPAFLIMVMTTFHVSAEGQPINAAWDERLTSLSSQFKKIKDKAAAWVTGKN